MEGTLVIFWQNRLDRTATPKYNLFFLRYRNFKSGAQRPKPIVGDDGLESYLMEIVNPECVKSCMQRIRAGKSVCIDNVMMPEKYLPAYGN